MIDPQKLNEMLRGRILVMKILWTAMTLTVLLFVGLAYFMAQQKPVAALVVSPLRIALYAAAVAVAIFAYFLRGMFLSPQRNQALSSRDAELRGAFADAQPAETDELMPAQEKRLKAIEAQINPLATRYFNALLLSLALHEAIAICGLLLTMTEHRFEAILPFAVTAIVLDLLVYPRLGKYVEQNAVGASSF